jgi:two-component system, cell cycle sensor histidine kinase and response regulator CckA
MSKNSGGAKALGIVLVAVALAVSAAFIIHHRFLTGEYAAQAEQTRRLARALDTQVIDRLRGAAAATAQAEWVRRAALGELGIDNPETLLILETTRTNFNAAIVYVMNAGGDVVACTPYGEGKTLTGNNYAFRPYFLEAMQGKSALYPALGVTTFERGLYSSAPVYHYRDDRPAGVLVIKSGLEPIDHMLADFGERAAMVSPEGAVFAADRPEWLFRLSRQPLSEGERARLLESRQFADQPLEGLPGGLNLAEAFLQIDGKRFGVVRVPVGIEGPGGHAWEVLSVHNFQGAYPTSLMLGVMAAIIAMTTILALYHSSRQARAELQRETSANKEYLATTLNSIGEAVIAADIGGCVRHMNPAAERLTGWPLMEAAGKPLAEVFRIINARTRESATDPVGCVLETGEVLKPASDTALVARDGSECQIAHSAAPIRTDAGNISGVVLVFSDVTIRNQAEKALRESEASLQAILRSTADGILAVNNENRVLFANERFVEMWMIPQEVMDSTDDQVLLQTVLGQLSDPESFLEKVQRVYKSNEDSFDTLEFKDGRAFDRLSRPLMQGAELRGRVWLFRDITERRRAAGALRESEGKLKSIFLAAPVGIGLSCDRVIVEANDSLCRMTGYSHHELVGQNAQILYPTIEDYEYVGQEKYRQIAATGTGTVETRWRRKDNAVIPIILGSTPLDIHDLSKGVTFTALDISERKRAEEKLRRLAEAVQQASDAVVITSPDGKIEYVNPAFEQITGYSLDEAIGQNPRILKSGKQDQAFYKNLWDTILSGNRWAGRIINKRKGGALFTEDCSIAPVRNEHGQIERFVAVKRDITKELELEERFQQTDRLESVGRLAAGVAHDMNNLLSPILGYAEMLLFDLDPSGEHYRQVQVIKESAERSRDLIRQLLAFGRKQVLEIRVLDLCRVVGDMEKLLGRTIREDIAIETILHPVACPVLADASQIGQVLMNLAVNAQDAMPGIGNLTIEVSPTQLDEAYCREHTDAKPGDYVMLAVSDTGCGMEGETRRHIFEPFFTTKKDSGTGLGLATVYGIVKQHGGNIGVYSEPGHGTTFKVHLPAVRGETSTAQAQASALKELRGSETVLVVEDNDMARDLANHILERQGYTILSAASGREALQLLTGHGGPVHLLLTDVIMPGMDGKALSLQATRQHPRLKVLFMSGYPQNVIAHHGVLEKGLHFIQKPFSVTSLAEKVRQVLDA